MKLPFLCQRGALRAALLGLLLTAQAVVAAAQVQQAAPVFSYPPTPANGQTYRIAQGQAFMFTVRAIDVNPADVLTLQAQGVPAGARMSGALPARGNPVQSTFSWTPTAAEAGTYVLSFVVSDGVNTPVTTSVTVEVRVQPCNPVANQPTAQPDQFSTAASTPLTLTPAALLANDVNPQNQALRIASVGAPSVGTLRTNPDGTFTYVPEAGFTGLATFTYFVLPAGNVLASEATGHYYEFVESPAVCWAAARAAAATRTYRGLSGYLATITSPAENALLSGYSRNRYWLGGADDVVEGEWRWKTGPEAGQLFWRGGVSGTAAAHSNWAPDEPNDFRNQFRPVGEDYALLYGQSGLWNDGADCSTDDPIEGYIVEYGGQENCTPVFFATGTVTIAVGQVLSSAGRQPSVHVVEAVPNPSNGNLQMRLRPTASGPGQLDLFDTHGKFVRQLFAGSLQADALKVVPLNLQDLAAGMYVVRFRSNQQVQYLRIAVQP